MCLCVGMSAGGAGLFLSLVKILRLPGQLQDLRAGLMCVTLTPMGRRDAIQQPPDSFAPLSLCRFIVKLLLQSNPPEQCASTISRRVCPQTPCLALQTLSPSAHANWLNGSNANKEVACAASFCSRPWEGGSWEGACPNHKAPSFEKEGLISGSTESRREPAAQS